MIRATPERPLFSRTPSPGSSRWPTAGPISPSCRRPSASVRPRRESADKLPARGRGRGRGGRGGRVLEFPDSSEEEELGEDDVEDDCSSSPSLSDSED